MRQAILYAAEFLGNIIAALLLAALCLLAGLGLLHIAHGAELNLPLVRDLVCHWETRNIHESKKDSYVGDDEELGRCQILPSTAKDMGIAFHLLGRRDVSEAAALLYLEHCAHVMRRTDVATLGRCYNGGPRSISRRAYWYGKTLAAAYAERTRADRWARHSYQKVGP